jgi:hypothetical protein
VKPKRSTKVVTRAKAGQSTPAGKAPILWTGVLFALAANVFTVTVVDLLLKRLQAGLYFELLATVAAPVAVGWLTARYVRRRGGMHAFIGGMASIPVLALWVFPGQWPLALFAGAFCGLSGALTEKALRRRGTAGAAPAGQPPARPKHRK